ncbi:nascent polypeptide-associated complex protein [Candidatus Micrarchaeota archaeon]|nr:nascent polypeptide-associated complex protein [Candidatus Micrarchaeota archaeon]MBD3417458.1 nascent polypeptide-associated complex protein [Candidatus Micrarchaeota archaeon]
MPNMDPKQMARMMKQMGINTEEVAAERVIIETADEKMVVEPAQVTKISMQGQTSFQISGNVRTEQSLKDEDIELVMEKAGCTREQATEALTKSGGDIAEAIISFQQEEA